jgi:hypothetical protein
MPLSEIIAQQHVGFNTFVPTSHQSLRFGNSTDHESFDPASKPRPVTQGRSHGKAFTAFAREAVAGEK